MTEYKSYDELPVVLTPEIIQNVLCISRNTVYEVIHSEGFPSFQVGKQWRVRKEDFIKWMGDKSVA